MIISVLFSCQSNDAEETKSAHLETELLVAHQEVKRVGMVIKIKPDRLEEYLAVHSDSEPGVRDLLAKYNLRNFLQFS